MGDGLALAEGEDRPRGIGNAADLENMSSELIVGQWIGDALRQASGPRPSGDGIEELSRPHAAGGVG
jgi:hypothetical protein